ncbi:MAG: DUF1559 domain-containing protein [Pirellulales bacterium]
MSQFPNQYPSPQGYGPQGYGPQGYPPPNKAGGIPVALVIVGVIGVIFVGIAICGILVGLLLPAVQAARTAARRMNDTNNMKQVVLAFHNYESANRRLPAPITVNSSNQKVWSWTVSLLPFCEESGIYSQVNFMDMQPWDAPQNAALQQPSPACFQSTRAIDQGNCHVFVISAPTQQTSGNPMFIEGTYTKFSDVSDGLSNTIMTIMFVKHSVPWASPATLTIDEAYRLVQNEAKMVLVGMGDGSVIPIPTSIDQATFNAMATRDGGEKVNIPQAY